MDRRGFVASLAALGATAALPDIAEAAESNSPAGGGSGVSSQTKSALRMAALRDEMTRQLTTFNLKQKSKTLPVRRGKRVTIGEVKGEG
jgi:hypothetical protein